MTVDEERLRQEGLQEIPSPIRPPNIATLNNLKSLGVNTITKFV